MDVTTFIDKWKKVKLSETSSAQQHFLDLCDLFHHPKPAQADPLGSWFTFEKRVEKTNGADGRADVWKRRYFAWEYKRPGRDLDAAYEQLCQYRDGLENPPLLVVSDIRRTRIHTCFTNTCPAVHEIALEDLAEPRHLETLRSVFHSPLRLKPGLTSPELTVEAAQRIAKLSQRLRERGSDAREVAHFLDRLIFAFFAQDVGLLPGRLVSLILDRTLNDGPALADRLQALFAEMRRGGWFGPDMVRAFGGPLYEPGPIPPLTQQDRRELLGASRLPWSKVEPAIFGTLFERGLDPGRRAQLGAHYTDPADIETLVESVVMLPLRRKWHDTFQRVENLLSTGKAEPGRKVKPVSEAGYRKARREAQSLVRAFHIELTRTTVLDPACGSGNFLYVALQKLKDLEREVIYHSGDRGLDPLLPLVGPWQLLGIEVNPYAHELARMTVWIGYLQWIFQHGLGEPEDPVLASMDDAIRCADALLDESDPAGPREATWPKVTHIVGNPPFLGGNKIRAELGDARADALFEVFRDRIPATSDLCCYWFEKARQHIADGLCERAGLLATQSIRGGANRRVLERIKEGKKSDIFFAESDRPWVLEGAQVHVSMVGFDHGAEKERSLDGRAVEAIHADLTAGPDLTQARRLPQRRHGCVYGSQQKAPFDLSLDEALPMLVAANPSGRPNSDVIRLSVNAARLLQGGEPRFVVDFGEIGDEAEAAAYEAPFEHLRRNVQPLRRHHREARQRELWWLHARPSPRYRAYLRQGRRCLVTPAVAKHRLFVWLGPEELADHATLVFLGASGAGQDHPPSAVVEPDDDLLFGLLHSRLHRVWALATGTQLRDRASGFRYTPRTCFETFPFPPFVDSAEPAGRVETAAADRRAVAAAARRLDDPRRRWLRPPEWLRDEILEFPGRSDGPWAAHVHEPDATGLGTVRYALPVPRDDTAASQLAERTLTRLYNRSPAWLAHLHRSLDEAVAAAYGWPADLEEEEVLRRLLELNQPAA